ncbi:hypothetical protein PDG61_21100 [Mycolicibacterium sp. BiH015]|uniref:hypothetical protein n=1 Tax=Mycolicibacterium sp. BiH015 TaxID=3018808 RepID=UPI0022DFE446|nr:hypothetical protein [Mycolicibacterium sp. BiH015]MDA2893426.1 hypothetical protein [Mycolicibacterium sp. BiH015]
MKMTPDSSDWIDDDSMSREETLKRFAALRPVPTAALGPRPVAGIQPSSPSRKLIVAAFKVTLQFVNDGGATADDLENVFIAVKTDLERRGVEADYTAAPRDWSVDFVVQVPRDEPNDSGFGVLAKLKEALDAAGVVDDYAMIGAKALLAS